VQHTHNIKSMLRKLMGVKNSGHMTRKSVVGPHCFRKISSLPKAS